MTPSLGALVMGTMVGIFALIKFLFRRARGKRVLTIGAMSHFQRPADDDVHPADLRRPRQQVKADPPAASSLDSVKKALDEIDEALAEMASPQQLRTPL
jgi:hypothetical protein